MTRSVKTRPGLPLMLENVLRTRRAFRNWLTICAVVGIAAPSSLPPRRGLPWLGERRLRFVTREGPVLETEAGNGSPIIEVFAYGEYDLPLDWTALQRVLDVGAHVGSFALWTCARAPAAHVVSVEPEPRNFSDLVANIDRNGLTDRVRAVHAALAGQPGIVTLHVPMNRESGSALATGGTSVEAAGVSVAELLERFDGPIDLLKLDCEGAEWPVLANLDAAVWEKIPRLVMECHARGSDSVDAMLRILERHDLDPTILHRAPSSVAWCDEIAVIWAQRRPA